MLGSLVLLAAAQVQVDISARPDCPPAEVVERDIQDLIGASPAELLEVSIELQDTTHGVLAEVSYTQGANTQTRVLEGATCPEVVNAAALVVAVGVDPIAVQRTVAPLLQHPSHPIPPAEPLPELPAPLEPVATPGVTPPVSDVESASTAERTPRQLRRSVGLFARGGAVVGSLSEAGGWVGGGAALGLGPISLEVSAQHAFAVRVEHSVDASTGARVSMTAARPSGCWTPRLGAFTLGACLGADFGAVRGAGFGLERRGTASIPWIAATPGLRMHWHASRRVALGFALDFPVSLMRPTLSIDDFEAPVTQVGRSGVWAGLSFQFTFFDESS